MTLAAMDILIRELFV